LLFLLAVGCRGEPASDHGSGEQGSQDEALTLAITRWTKDYELEEVRGTFIQPCGGALFLFKNLQPTPQFVFPDLLVFCCG